MSAGFGGPTYTIAPCAPPLAYDVTLNSRIIARFIDRESAEAYVAALARWSSDGSPDGLHPDAVGAGTPKGHAMRGPATVGSARYALDRAMEQVERMIDGGDQDLSFLLARLREARDAMLDGNIE